MDKNSPTTDIFCLSEVQPELFSKLEFMLPHFRGFYEVGRFDKVMGLTYGQAAFVKRGIEAQILGKVDTFRNVYNDMGFAMSLILTINKKPVYLMNVHGKARPGHKLDTPARARQSQKIINFLKSKEGPKIIGGDFNLMPSTYAVRLFEKEDYRNLIKDFEIKSTRNRLSWEQFASGPGFVRQYYADYVFVSPDVKVKNFEVPNVEISDHLPLILDFEI